MWVTRTAHFRIERSWEPFKGFKISADYNFFGKNYADFDPQNRVNEADAGIDSGSCQIMVRLIWA